MKKFLQTLMLAAAMLLPFVSQAQNTLTFDFEDGLIPSDWTNNSTNPWVVTSTSQNSGHQGTYCIMSGNAGVSSSQSSISATFTFAGDGSISFLAGIFGEGTSSVWDHCTFKIDGQVMFDYGARGTWEVYSFELEAGTHSFEWFYDKDGSVNPTGDAFYLDSIVVDLGTASGCPRPSVITVSNVTGTTATISWTAGGTETSWNVYRDSVLEANVSTPSYSFTGLSGETTYNVAVEADCGSEQSNWRTTTFTTGITCPAPTGLSATLTPGDGTVATLNWHEAGTATAWQIWFSGDTTNYIDVYDTTYTFTTLTPETAYTAKVRAICDVDDLSAWSSTITFTPTNAYLITVNDGTTTNSYVPIYGFYCDDITKSQFIIPAADLTALVGGTITKLTFYASQASVNWGAAEFNVYLTTTSETGVATLADYTTMTHVYAGSLSISDNKMEVNMTTPFVYAGGNLMVGFKQTVEGSYVSSSWYGVTAEGASMGGYGSSISQRNFLPKTTINYTPGGADICLPVSGLTASDITTDSATISWSGTANSYTIIDLSDSTTVATISDTFYVFSGLTAMTQYSFGVVANCATDQSFMMNVSFTTACAAVTIPFTEDFEAASTTLGCWSASNLDANSGLAPATYAYSGSSCFLFSYNTNPPQYLISPELDGTEDGLAVSFMYKVQSTSYPESFQLGYSTTTNDTAAFTWGTEQTNLVNTTYQAYSELLPANVKYVAIKYTANDMYYLFIDSMVFDVPPTCAPVTDLIVDSVTSSSIFLSWNDNNNTGATYSIYGADGSVIASGISTTNYEVTGLLASTSYTFGVVANCSATDASNVVTVSASTTIECAGGSCFVELNGADSYGDGWNGNAINVMQNGNLIETFTLTEGDINNAHITVCSGAPVVFTWVAGSYPDEASFEIKNGAGLIVYTGVGSTSMATGDTIFVLNNACPTCLPVTNMTVTDATETSVTISWAGTAASYNVYNGTAFVANVNTNSYTFTGLTTSTNYTFGVMAICSDTDSADMVTITTTTSCSSVAINLPFTETFNATSGSRNCWTTVDGDGDGFGWSTLFNGLDQEMMLSFSYDNDSYTALTPNNWLISPILHSTAGSNVTMQWSVAAGDDSYYAEHYGVYISTTTNDTSAFTLLQDWTLTSDADQIMNLDLSAYAGQDFYVAFRHFNCTNQFVLILDDVQIYEGVYVPDTLTVTFATANAAMGTTNPVPGTYQYITGDTVVLSATPTAGHRFVGWAWDIDGDVDTLGVEYIALSFPADIFMDYGSMTFTALFEAGNPDSTTVTYAVNNPAMGTTTPAPGTYTIYVGSTIEASATANAGYYLDAWVLEIVLDGDVYSSDTLYSDDPEFENPIDFGILPQSFADYGASLVITAIFAVDTTGPVDPDYINMTFAVNDATMGTITPNGTQRLQVGTEFTVIATPAADCYLESWTLTMPDSISVTLDEDVPLYFTDTVTVDMNGSTLTANFARNQGIDDVETGDFSVYTQNDRIVVKGVENLSVNVYDVTGRCVKNVAKATETVEVTVPAAGVYMVKAGNFAAKRVVVLR